MPVYTAEALILRTYKLGEADRIVVFLTRDRGKKRGVAKGARRPRSRYAGALEPMTRAGVAYYEREMRDLVRLNYVEPQRSPLSAIGLAATVETAVTKAGLAILDVAPLGIVDDLGVDVLAGAEHRQPRPALGGAADRGPHALLAPDVELL